MNKHFLSHLMHGLTYIIPLLLVSGFMIIIRPLFSTDFQISYLTPMIEFLWMLLFPLFSAFVMFSIADRPGDSSRTCDWFFDIPLKFRLCISHYI